MPIGPSRIIETDPKVAAQIIITMIDRLIQDAINGLNFVSKRLDIQLPLYTRCLGDEDLGFIIKAYEDEGWELATFNWRGPSNEGPILELYIKA